MSAFNLGLPGISNSILSNPLYSAVQNIVSAWYGGGAQNPLPEGGIDNFSPSWDFGSDFGGGDFSGGGGGPMNGTPIAGDAQHYGTIYNRGGGLFAVQPGRSIPYGSRKENQPAGTENNVGVYSMEYALTHTNSQGQIVDTASDDNAPLIEKNITGDWAGVKSSYWTDRLVNYSLVHPETKEFIKDFINSNNKGENFAPGIAPIEDEEFNQLLSDYGKKRGISQDALDNFNKSFSKFEPDGAVNDTIEGINENGEITNIREYESETASKTTSSKDDKSPSSKSSKTDGDKVESSTSKKTESSSKASSSSKGETKSKSTK